VRAVGAVVDGAAAGAAAAAAAQLCVERVEDVGVDCADLLVSDQRPDVLVDVAAVRRERGALSLDRL
jgi:hypothetical protein